MVPPAVVIVTARIPVVVPDETVTLTVASVPSLLTVGGLPTLIPSAGTKAIPLACCRFRPFTCRVKVEPTAP